MYIDAKRKRLGPMGRLVPFEHQSGFDESYGGILNYNLTGKEGGFFFYTARKGSLLIFIQAYSTTRGQIPESERDDLIDTVCSAIQT